MRITKTCRLMRFRFCQFCLWILHYHGIIWIVHRTLFQSILSAWLSCKQITVCALRDSLVLFPQLINVLGIFVFNGLITGCDTSMSQVSTNIDIVLSPVHTRKIVFDKFYLRAAVSTMCPFVRPAKKMWHKSAQPSTGNPALAVLHHLYYWRQLMRIPSSAGCAVNDCADLCHIYLAGSIYGHFIWQRNATKIICSRVWLYTVTRAGFTMTYKPKHAGVLNHESPYQIIFRRAFDTL